MPYEWLYKDWKQEVDTEATKGRTKKENVNKKGVDKKNCLTWSIFWLVAGDGKHMAGLYCTYIRGDVMQRLFIIRMRLRRARISGKNFGLLKDLYCMECFSRAEVSCF